MCTFWVVFISSLESTLKMFEGILKIESGEVENPRAPVVVGDEKFDYREYVHGPYSKSDVRELVRSAVQHSVRLRTALRSGSLVTFEVSGVDGGNGVGTPGRYSTMAVVKIQRRPVDFR